MNVTFNSRYKRCHYIIISALLFFLASRHLSLLQFPSKVILFLAPRTGLERRDGGIELALANAAWNIAGVFALCKWLAIHQAIQSHQTTLRIVERYRHSLGYLLCLKRKAAAGRKGKEMNRSRRKKRSEHNMKMCSPTNGTRQKFIFIARCSFFGHGLWIEICFFVSHVFAAFSSKRNRSVNLSIRRAFCSLLEFFLLRSGRGRKCHWKRLFWELVRVLTELAGEFVVWTFRDQELLESFPRNKKKIIFPKQSCEVISQSECHQPH